MQIKQKDTMHGMKYIDGKWKVIDTSYDAQMAQNGHDYAMYKDSRYFITKRVNINEIFCSRYKLLYL